MVMTLEKALEYIESVNTSNDEKISLLGFISRHFEYLTGNEHNEQAIEISNKLITQLIKETDKWVRDELLSTLVVIVGGYLPIGPHLKFEPILKNLNSFSIDEISNIIGLLGWSRNQEYRKMIESYGNISELADDVKDALIALDYGKSRSF